MARATFEVPVVDAVKDENANSGPQAEDPLNKTGKKHALKHYRGKVVVLDFWYRNCGWCLRAMPQVKEAATHFRGRPGGVSWRRSWDSTIPPSKPRGCRKNTKCRASRRWSSSTGRA